MSSHKNIIKGAKKHKKTLDENSKTINSGGVFHSTIPIDNYITNC